MRDLDDRSHRISLFLFGAGYRAMLFHLGALRRLNDLGLLPRLTKISSVSGGSIVAGRLAAIWRSLEFEANGVARNFAKLMVPSLSDLAATSSALPRPFAGVVVSKLLQHRAHAWFRQLTGERSLADLPAKPEFVFKATNLQTGGVWSFSRNSIGDFRIGDIAEPKLEFLPLATVVAASAALPPLAPVVLKPAAIGEWSTPVKPEFSNPAFRNRVVLCDGCASDDFDLNESSSNAIVLVSDAGAVYPPQPSPGLHWLSPKFGALQFGAVQIYQRHKRDVLRALEQKECRGAYWDMASDAAATPADGLDRPSNITDSLSRLPATFNKIDGNRQQDLMDCGYASSDASVRTWLNDLQGFKAPDASPNGSFFQNRPTMTAGAA